ncbi:MAG: hypothetical protein KF784_01975 [Fimbriimonadaceae bacterium]|nr:hypothetical protein [Fimbriimonadaceae bacterium]
MKALRFALSVFAVLGLVGGYFASQYAYFTGQAATYAARVDQQPVWRLSLALLLVAIVLSFVKDRESS